MLKLLMNKDILHKKVYNDASHRNFKNEHRHEMPGFCLKKCTGVFEVCRSREE